MRYHTLLLLLLLMVTAGCGSKRVSRPAPTILRLTDTTVMQPLTISGDSSALRLVIDCLPTGPRVREVGATLGGPRLSWSIEGGLLRLSARERDRQMLLPFRTITREIPVEVPREVARPLRWYERGLMYVGAVALLALLIRLLLLLKR